mmetsp:Transcript_101989/g.288813  ORF Transcript_101989/g.288813 Transcript_101989/m.288813 type:complete len:273 (-) Transcript_101989:55-873(-)
MPRGLLAADPDGVVLHGLARVERGTYGVLVRVGIYVQAAVLAVRSLLQLPARLVARVGPRRGGEGQGLDPRRQRRCLVGEGPRGILEGVHSAGQQHRLCAELLLEVPRHAGIVAAVLRLGLGEVAQARRHVRGESVDHGAAGVRLLRGLRELGDCLRSFHVLVEVAEVYFLLLVSRRGVAGGCPALLPQALGLCNGVVHHPEEGGAVVVPAVVPRGVRGGFCGILGGIGNRVVYGNRPGTPMHGIARHVPLPAPPGRCPSGTRPPLLAPRLA